jgi:CheY-like chemotaxis protein
VTERSGRGRALILFVERDPNVRELEAYFLEEAGFSVEFAEEGVSALTRACELRPDILITEILVPRLEGLALCRKLKAEPATRDIAVLVFSILMAAGRAQEAGADAFQRLSPRWCCPEGRGSMPRPVVCPGVPARAPRVHQGGGARPADGVPSIYQ